MTAVSHNLQIKVIAIPPKHQFSTGQEILISFLNDAKHLTELYFCCKRIQVWGCFREPAVTGKMRCSGASWLTSPSGTRGRLVSSPPGSRRNSDTEEHKGDHSNWAFFLPLWVEEKLRIRRLHSSFMQVREEFRFSTQCHSVLLFQLLHLAVGNSISHT